MPDRAGARSSRPPTDRGIGFQPPVTELARDLIWLEGFMMVILTVITVLVMGLLLLGAANRWWLVPAVARGKPEATLQLRCSIAVEASLMVMIVLVAAVLLTTSSPVR